MSIKVQVVLKFFSQVKIFVTTQDSLSAFNPPRNSHAGYAVTDNPTAVMSSLGVCRVHLPHMSRFSA